VNAGPSDPFNSRRTANFTAPEKSNVPGAIDIRDALARRMPRELLDTPEDFPKEKLTRAWRPRCAAD
jgi:hypothetical protein